jgi:hypothetical protein
MRSSRASDPHDKRLFSAEEVGSLNRAVAKLWTGSTRAQAATEIGYSAQTLSVWLDTPTGRQIISKYEMETRERATRLLATGQTIALKTLLQAMNEAPNWSDKIRAAAAFTSIQERTVVIAIGDGPLQSTPAVERILSEVANIRQRNAGIIEATVADDDDVDPAG